MVFELGVASQAVVAGFLALESLLGCWVLDIAVVCGGRDLS
jgi:hypothetical protein